MWSGLNKHKQKHSDQAGDSFTVCCLFCKEGFKREELCDEHMCAGKLEHKKHKNQDKNGSVKPSSEDVAEVKEEPQSDPKFPGNKNVESFKKKLKVSPVPLRMLRGGSKK